MEIPKVNILEIVSKQQVTFQEAFEVVSEYIFEKKNQRLEQQVNFNPNNPMDSQLLGHMYETSREYFRKKYNVKDPTTLSIHDKDGQLLMQTIVKEENENEKDVKIVNK